MKVADIDSYRKVKKSKNNYKIPNPVIYIFLVAVGLYFFIHSPFFTIENINVTGNYLLDTEKILNLSQVNKGQNLIKIDKKEIIKRISVHPFVKEVEIKRGLPDTLKINVIERKPVGLLVCPDGFIQVSKEGVFLALIHDIGEYNLPVISGIDLEQLPGPGQVIKNDELSLALGIISESFQELLNDIVEINIENKGHILAYTLDGIEIRLGSLENISEKLYDLNHILEDFNTKGLDDSNIEYIDLRFSGPPVIKRK
ncbi:MAG: hypothetical protein VR72_19770 [Clostridiaceae bacterium BRH_c20a]|nr:MAG: hypothetical protein VR72_19770 [Clostridiaceae bacterium BRH_c20a]